MCIVDYTLTHKNLIKGDSSQAFIKSRILDKTNNLLKKQFTNNLYNTLIGAISQFEKKKRPLSFS